MNEIRNPKKNNVRDTNLRTNTASDVRLGTMSQNVTVDSVVLARVLDISRAWNMAHRPKGNYYYAHPKKHRWSRLTLGTLWNTIQLFSCQAGLCPHPLLLKIDILVCCWRRCSTNLSHRCTATTTHDQKDTEQMLQLRMANTKSVTRTSTAHDTITAIPAPPQIALFGIFPLEPSAVQL